MKTLLLFLVSVFFVNSASCQTIMMFSVLKTIFVKGTHKVICYRANNDSILVTKYSINNLPEITMYAEPITEQQSISFQNFSQKNNLSSLNDTYENRQVEGSHHTVYDISLGRQNKTVYLYYVSVTVLEQLDSLMESCLPQEQDGWHCRY